MWQQQTLSACRWQLAGFLCVAVNERAVLVSAHGVCPTQTHRRLSTKAAMTEGALLDRRGNCTVFLQLVLHGRVMRDRLVYAAAGTAG